MDRLPEKNVVVGLPACEYIGLDLRLRRGAARCGNEYPGRASKNLMKN